MRWAMVKFSNKGSWHAQIVSEEWPEWTCTFKPTVKAKSQDDAVDFIYQANIDDAHV